MIFLSYVSRDRKMNVAYKGVSQLPREPELKELKLYVGMLKLGLRFLEISVLK